MVSAGLRHATLVLSALLLSTAAVAAHPATASGGGAAASLSAASSPDGTAAAAAAERLALRDAIWRLERSLRHRLAIAGRGEPLAAGHPGRLVKELGELRGVLRSTGRRLGPTAGGELVRKADALAPLLDDGGAARERGHPQRARSLHMELEVPSSRLDAAAAAACGNALAVGDGASPPTWLGAPATAASSGCATPPRPGHRVASTAGSDFDTVVEVRRLPGAAARRWRAANDEVGLQARAAFRPPPARPRGSAFAAGTERRERPRSASRGGGAGFAGIVIDGTTGEGVAGGRVEVWTAAGTYWASTESDSDGSYVVGGLAPGTTSLRPGATGTTTSGCSTSCTTTTLPGWAPGLRPPAGTPIAVPPGIIPTASTFSRPGAAISGRVREAATGLVVANSEVRIYRANGSSIGETYTDAAGRYSLSGLGTGVAYAVGGYGYDSPYARELYRDLPCPPGCIVTNGTPISTVIGQTTPGIDFRLDRFGAIAGTLTEVVGGAPVSFGSVQIYDAQLYLPAVCLRQQPASTGGRPGSGHLRPTLHRRPLADDLIRRHTVRVGVHSAAGQPCG